MDMAIRFLIITSACVVFVLISGGTVVYSLVGGLVAGLAALATMLVASWWSSRRQRKAAKRLPH